MQKKISLKNRIIFSIIGIIAVLGILAAIIIFFVAKFNFDSIRRDSLRSLAIDQAREVGQMFAGPRKLIDTIALQHEFIHFFGSDSHQQEVDFVSLLNHHNSIGLYDRLDLVDMHGTTLVSTDPGFTGRSNHNSQDYFKRALNGLPTIAAATDGAVGDYGYFLSAPVVASDGRVIGVLVGKIFASSINEFLRGRVLVNEESLMLVDTDGIVLYATDPQRVLKSIGTLSPEKKNEIIDTQRFGNMTISGLQYDKVIAGIRTYTEPNALDFYDAVDGEDEIIALARVPGAPFFVVFEAEAGFLAGPALIIVIVLSIAAFFSALFGGSLIYLFLMRFLRPLGLFKNAAEQISEGDYSYRLALKTGDEFEDVANAFNSMVQRLQEAYATLEEKISQKTRALSQQLDEVEKKNIALHDTQRAVLNVLEDARLLELQIQEERDRLRGIVASMGEGLFVFDRDFRIILANTTAERLLGVPLALIEGTTVTELITLYKGKTIVPYNERPIYKIVADGADVQIDVEDDLYWEVKNGKKFSVGFSGAPISVGGLVGGVIIFRDLTLEKNLEEARMSFISVTSHQLRTPLTSLKWFLEMLMDGSYAQPLTPEQKNFSDLAYQAANRMMGIINLLLQIARVEAGRVKIMPTPTNIAQFAQNIVASFGNAFDLKKQTVVVIATPDPLPAVSIDADVFGQVLQNLISNANRYALESSTITVAFKVENEHILCSVTDKGIGIAKIEADRIFEKFYRTENALRMIPEGSGLGLSLVKSLVEGWGGTIWFESEEWKGTTFFFTLPLTGMIAREGEVGIRVT